jgi:hypothetical protein
VGKSIEEPDLTDENENMCLMFSQRSMNAKHTSRFSTEAGDISLLSPPEQFIDTNNSNNCLMKTSELQAENLHLDKDQKEPLCSSSIPKTAYTFHQADPQNFTSHLSVYQTSGPQGIGSISNKQLPTNGPLKEKDKISPLLEDLDFKILPEKEDCGEDLFSELTMYFPALTTSEPLFRDNRQAKTREDYMRELFFHSGNIEEEDTQDILERIDFNRKSNITVFDQMTEELYLALIRKVEWFKDEEACLHLELEEIEKDWQRMEDRFGDWGTDYEVKKLKLHWSEIEKIVSLILSLTGRLLKIVAAVDNMEWNGVDERYELEKKRDKLTEQLNEAKLIWHKMEKRTKIVTGYIEQSLTRMEGIRFKRMIKRKIRTMLEIKEIQEKIVLGEKQMKDSFLS